MTTAAKNAERVENEKKRFNNEMKVDRIVGPSRIAFYCLIFRWQTIAVTTTVFKQPRRAYNSQPVTHYFDRTLCVFTHLHTVDLIFFFASAALSYSLLLVRIDSV